MPRLARAYGIAKWRTPDLGAGQGAAAAVDWVPGEGDYWLHLFGGTDGPSARFTNEATALATFRCGAGSLLRRPSLT